MENTAKAVQLQIDDLLSKRAQEIDSITKQVNDAEARISAADQAIRAATEKLDESAYDKALVAKRKAESALDMYNARRKQIEAHEIIPEAESDVVIASLKDYEQHLTEQFLDGVSGPLSELKKLRGGYLAAIQEAEQTMNRWTAEIHANYRSEHTRYADGTNRSPRPVPVRSGIYLGCPEAAIVDEFLRNMEGKA